MTKFGFSGLNQNLNNNQNSISTKQSQTKDNLENLIVIGRTIDIILDDKHPKFKELGEWTSLGIIEFVDINIQSNTTTPGTSLLYAKPLFPNTKNYPIFNEVVYIIALPNQGAMNDGASKQYYYFNPLNIWNHPHHNAIPFYINKTENGNKNYDITSLGSINQTKNTQQKIDLGPGFKEYSNIHPLLSYLGDYIIEGRWGNSIRIGSTYKKNTNNWSTSGENGNPITIIRNGQPKDSSSEGWLPITEDINKDLSSIWLTSNQKIPLKPSSESYKSYDKQPTKIPEYLEEQVIINSGRLVFNSNKDSILFSAKKTVNLNSIDSINIDTNNFITSAKTIKLGNKDTKNPMVLGNETIQALNTICTHLIKVCNSLSALAEILPTAPQVAVNIAASEGTVAITALQGQLNTLKSKTNFLI